MKKLLSTFAVVASIGLTPSAVFADCRNVVLDVDIRNGRLYKITKIEHWTLGKWRTVRSRSLWKSSDFNLTVARMKTPAGVNNKFRITAKRWARDKITFGVSHHVFYQKQQFESNDAICADNMTYTLQM